MTHIADQEMRERRADIDYLRVGALGLLIIYHTLLVFNSEWWRVKSEHAGVWADYLVSVLTPWRMSLVFLIAGMAARFMIERTAAGAFLRERAGKLLTAFAFAVIVIVPLQRFVRLDEDSGIATDYFHFLLLQARYAVHVGDIWLPDFANAWFLPYLFVYSALAVGLVRFLPGPMQRLQHFIEHAPLWLIVGFGMLWFAISETVLLPRYPLSGLLFPDVSAHFRFFPVFLFGLLIGKSHAFTTSLLQNKRSLWTAALLLCALSLFLQWRVMGGADGLLRYEWLASRGFYGMAMLFSTLAFGAWALSTPSPLLTWASDAILPIYLMHQTVLVVSADAIAGLHWSTSAEFLTLLAVTVLTPTAIYCLVVRRTPWLRVLFGLRPHARPWRNDDAPPHPDAHPAPHR